MGSGRGSLAGDWPSTGGVLNITAAAWTAGFLWRSRNKSERKMLASTCLYSVYAWVMVLCSADVDDAGAVADDRARAAASPLEAALRARVVTRTRPRRRHRQTIDDEIFDRLRHPVIYVRNDPRRQFEPRERCFNFKCLFFRRIEKLSTNFNS